MSSWMVSGPHGSIRDEIFKRRDRSSYGGCKVGVGDVLIGATQSIARYQGVESASHIRDKIVEMVHLNETLFACGMDRNRTWQLFVMLLIGKGCLGN